MNGSLFPRRAMCLGLGSAIVPETITVEGNGLDSPDLPSTGHGVNSTQTTVRGKVG